MAHLSAEIVRLRDVPINRAAGEEIVALRTSSGRPLTQIAGEGKGTAQRICPRAGVRRDENAHRVIAPALAASLMITLWNRCVSRGGEDARSGVLGRLPARADGFPDPTPGEGEVVIEMKASSMCGSDLHQYCQLKGTESIGGLPVPQNRLS